MEDVAEPLRQHGAQLARRDLAPDGGAGADDEYLQHHMHDGLPERHAAPVHRLLDGRHLLGLRAQQVPYDAGDAQSQRDGGDAADRRHGERAGNELAFDESEHHVFDAVQQQRQQAGACADDRAEHQRGRGQPADALPVGLLHDAPLRWRVERPGTGDPPMSAYPRHPTPAPHRAYPTVYTT